jgi:alpha-D-ribose 1-methylphosphonate 5-triphosphate synthase subunit PhnH
MNMTQAGLHPAWDDSVHDAQQGFRTILKALSEPGTIQKIPFALSAPAPLDIATTAVCLTLCDFDTPLWMNPEAANPALASYLRFHCGCPLVATPEVAAFALIVGPYKGLQLEQFAQGSPEYPDRSATLVIQVGSISHGRQRRLTGPGIAGEAILRVDGLPENFDAQWQQNSAAFPLGVDLIFCCGSAIVGLPRTTQLHSS